MPHLDDPEVAAALEILTAMHAEPSDRAGEGLRERKKRRTRQQISDVATAMFLIHGFDNVTVSKVAAACEVSEQTVFNYFPTKEAMFLDQADATTASLLAAVRDRRDLSLVACVVDAQPDDLTSDVPTVADNASRLRFSRLFVRAVEASPTLSATRQAGFFRLVDDLCVALAARIDAAPDDPQVQLTAVVVAGLAGVQQRSTYRHIATVTSLAELHDQVRADVLRAARIAEPTLAAFDADPATHEEF